MVTMAASLLLGSGGGLVANQACQCRLLRLGDDEQARIGDLGGTLFECVPRIPWNERSRGATPSCRTIIANKNFKVDGPLNALHHSSG